MDVSDGSKTAAGRDERVVGLHAGQLTDAADWHGVGGGGVRHASSGAGPNVARVHLSLK